MQNLQNLNTQKVLQSCFESVEFKELETSRALLLKRIKIAKILSFVEGAGFFALAFYFTSDLIIAIAIAALFAAFFFRLFSHKLFKRANVLEARILRLFLSLFQAKFSGASLSLDALLKQGVNLSENFPVIKDFKANNGLEFEEFSLFDMSFRAQNGVFLGVLLELKPKFKFKESLKTCEPNELLAKLKTSEFSTQKLLVKGNFALIASLSNPFYLNKSLNLKENFTQMSANLEKIQSLLNFR